MGMMEKKMETTIMSYIGYRRWGIWLRAYYNKISIYAIFYLLKGDYNYLGCC